MDNLKKEREYRSRTFNISGFALMTPLGHIFMDPIYIFTKFTLVWGCIYFISCFISFICGLYFIDTGHDILYKRRPTNVRD